MQEYARLPVLLLCEGSLHSIFSSRLEEERASRMMFGWSEVYGRRQRAEAGASMQ